MIQLTAEGSTSGVAYQHAITALSNTAVTIKLTAVQDLVILATIHVLGFAASNQAFIHLTAINP